MAAPRRAIMIYRNDEYLIDIDVITNDFVEGNYKVNRSFFPFLKSWSEWIGVGCFYMDKVTSIKFL